MTAVLVQPEPYATVDDLGEWLGFEPPEGSLNDLRAARRLFETMPQIQPIRPTSYTRVVTDVGDPVLFEGETEPDGGLVVVYEDGLPQNATYRETRTYHGGQPKVVRHTMGLDDEDNPTGLVETKVEALLDVMREASCAQVEYWLTVGNGQVDRSQDILRPTEPSRIGSIQIPPYRVLAPRALQVFLVAGTWRPQLNVTGSLGYRYWDW